MKNHRTIARVATVVVLSTTLGTHSVKATTYISVEPIPSRDVVGQAALTKILSAGYPHLERWSQRLLTECGMVQSVIDALESNGAISTINAGNVSFRVAAGGFESVTNPSFVATVDDSGPDGVSEQDVNVLDNALGFVLNQGGTAHFSPDNPKAYFFSLDYAVVTFDDRTFTGVEAKKFFDHLGTIDFALWGGQFAGFTQIDFEGAPTNNSMLFLKPAATKQRFISGLSAAASTFPDAEYVTLNNHGDPTTAKAGIAFPGNDWIAFPRGDQYLSNLPSSSPQLLSALEELRQQHFVAVRSLLDAIDKGKVSQYVNRQFRCPTLGPPAGR
jgi:hypothetical protein